MFRCLIAIMVLPWTLVAHAQSFSEDAIKAAYLHRFAAYVEWPDASEPGPFTIAVEGAEEVAAQLEQLLPGLTLQNRGAQVRRVHTAADLPGTRILYIGAGTRAQTRALIEAATRQPILLVTDSPDGLARGAAINFVRIERSVRFEVSITAAERSGLKIASGLLSVASHVEGRRQSGTVGCWPAHTATPCRWESYVALPNPHKQSSLEIN